MIQITKSIEWDMGHRIPNHKSKCRNLHGHRYKLEITLIGELKSITGDSEEGMIIDFDKIKTILKERIQEVLDHCFMIYEKDKILTEFFSINAKENLKVVTVPFIPTVENISRWCYQNLHDRFPENIYIKNIRVFESPNSWADFRQ